MGRLGRGRRSVRGGVSQRSLMACSTQSSLFVDQEQDPLWSFGTFLATYLTICLSVCLPDSLLVCLRRGPTDFRLLTLAILLNWLHSHGETMTQHFEDDRNGRLSHIINRYIYVETTG